jgi:hypothetical protein
VAAEDDDLFSLDFTVYVPVPPVPEPEPLRLVEPEPPPPPPPPPPEPEPVRVFAPAAPKYPELVLPPTLLAAGELYAQGKDMEACRLLELAIKSNQALGDMALRVWQALFELLQTLGRQQAFETLAMAYAKRFELSPPTWLASVAEDDVVNSSSGGRAHVSLAGTLNARVGDALKQMMKLAQSSSLVRLDLGKLVDADNDGAILVMRALTALKKAGKEYVFGSPEHLATILGSKLESGRRESEAMWLLLLELYQQAYLQDAFEEAAVNYAVTFEVSPPSFESLPPGRPVLESVSIPVAVPLSLRGQMLGAGPAEFAAIAACAGEAGAGDLDIDALSLVRIDAASVDALKGVLTQLNDAGYFVRIIGVSQLVAAFLAARNVTAQAELRIRKT